MSAPERADLVGSVMSRRVVGIRADCTLAVAADTFARTGLRHLVVVDAERRVRGLLTAERVLTALGITGRAGRVDDQVDAVEVSVGPADDIRLAASLMLDALVDAVLVTEPSGRVVGLLTWADVVTHVTGRELGVRPAQPARP